MKSKFIIIAVCVLLAGWIAFQLASNKKKLNEKNRAAPQSAIRIPVKVALVQQLVQETSITKTGNIAPFKEAKVLVLKGGMIRKLRFELGDQVKEGQILATLDMQSLELDLQKAESNASKLKNDLKVYTELMEGKAATQEKVNDITKNYQDAVNQVEQIKKSLADASIKSPITGIVASKSAEEGMFVNGGGEIASVIALSKAKVAVSLTEREVYQITDGQSVKIKADVFPSLVFSGRVSFISPQADATNSYRVEITFDNNDRSFLRSGTVVNVNFSNDKSRSLIAIPRDALLESIQNASVYVVADSVVHRKSIQTGVEMGGNIEVIKGLTVGDVVVTAGQINLKEGSKVSVTN